MKKISKERLLARAYSLLHVALDEPTELNVKRFNNVQGVLKRLYGIVIYKAL